MSYGVALGWAVSATILLLVLTQGLSALRSGARLDLVTLTVAEALIYVLAMFAVLRVHEPNRLAREAIGVRRSHPGLSALGLGLGLALLFPVESLRVIVERAFPTPPEQLVERALLFSAPTLGHKLALVLAVACVGPLVEELFFRGALFGVLRRAHGAIGAAIATALAFTFSHLDWRAWPVLLVVAAVLSHLRAASGSLLPCIALHVGFNAASVIALITGVSSVSRPLALPPAVVASSWLVSAGLVALVHWVATHSEEAEEARAEDSS
jgi:membrane protease YdiL (CAAX protease family)